MNLICIRSVVMPDEIVRLSVTCKTSKAASKSLQNFIHLSLAKFWSKPQKAANFCKILRRNFKDITAADKK